MRNNAMQWNELYHFGIIGQKWGQQNGPPYPLSEAKSASVTKKGLRERIAEAKEKHDKKKAVREARKQLRQAKRDAKDAKKQQKLAKKTAKIRSRIKDPKKMTTDELRDRINRLQLEQQYYKLTTPEKKEKENKAVKWIGDVFENSSKNIGTQLVTYAMGTAVNTVAGDNIVNPKKGQKDK